VQQRATGAAVGEQKEVNGTAVLLFCAQTCVGDLPTWFKAGCVERWFPMFDTEKEIVQKNSCTVCWGRGVSGAVGGVPLESK
jgi:hypothetical protein